MGPKSSRKREELLGIGVALGAGVGTALGTAFDQIALGVALGTGIGTALGIVFSQMPAAGDDDGEDGASHE